MSEANGSNGTEWAQAFAAFHGRHKSKDGKKLKFTVVFNAHMDAFINEAEVPLEWRVLAWIWRCSWGNNSDFAVQKIGGESVGQQDCADALRVDKRRVNDAVAFLRALNFVKLATGHKLYPVDDPTSQPSESPAKSPRGGGLFKEFCAAWKVQAPADFQELESANATVSRIKKVRWGLFKKWRTARTNGAASFNTTLQPSSNSLDSGGRASSGAVDPSAKRAAPPPPPPPPAELSKKAPQPKPSAPEWHAKLRKILAALPIGTELDEPMFGKIAGHLSEVLLDQFETEAQNAEGIRKWSGYEDIARQVGKRGLVMAAAAGGSRPSAKKSFKESIRSATAGNSKGRVVDV